MTEQSARFKCEVCGATFMDADALTRHRAVHNMGNTGDSDKPEKEDLEQGTQPPTQNPTIPPAGPSLSK